MDWLRCATVLLVLSVALGFGRTAESDAASDLPGVASDLERQLMLASQPVSSTSREAALAALRNGIKLGGDGNLDGATRAFERASTLFPGIDDWIHALMAQAAAASGDTAGVRQHLAAASHVLDREWGWRARIDAQRKAGDLSGAVSAARSAAAEVSSAVRRAAAWNAAAEVQLQRRDTAEARDAYRRALREAAGSAAGLRAARGLETLPGLTASDRLVIARTDLRHGNRTSGIGGLRAYLVSPGSSVEERSVARLELTRALFQSRRYDEAERLAREAAADLGRPDLAAQAQLLVGRVQRGQGRNMEAHRSLLRTAERFPGESAAAEALFIVADLQHDAGELTSARGHYRRITALQPGSDQAAAAYMRLGGIALSAGEAQPAASLFEEYRRNHPSGHAHLQATYWASRAYLAAGDSTRARERLEEVARLEPVSFYGLRAAELLGNRDPVQALTAAPATSTQVSNQAGGGLARIDVLDELGLTEAASFETERLKDHLARQPGGLYSLAEMYHARGQSYEGILLGREIQRTAPALDLRLLRIIYPFPFRELVVREAASNGVDPFLIAGLIRQESMFKPTAVSRAGAIGLMQVMPSTGRTLARDVGMTRFDTGQLKQPAVNIRLGTRFVADLLKQHHGNVAEVLAAYNAGPGRVRRWSQLPEHRDLELFAERIPFDETRHYVRVVQQNARLYAALYGPGLQPKAAR